MWPTCKGGKGRGKERDRMKGEGDSRRGESVKRGKRKERGP